MRDNFDNKTRVTLAQRVNYHCSNCWSLTSGPQQEPTKSSSIGVAAHITAASEGGPRYDAQMSQSDRKSIQNAIWLCQNCAKLVDSDSQRYSTDTLKELKLRAEERVRQELSRSMNSSVVHSQAIAYRFTSDADPSSHEMQYNLMYVGRVIGKLRNTVESFFGYCNEVNIVNIGSLNSIPEGGEIRSYDYEGYTLSIYYDLNDVIQGVRFEDFEKYQYTLDNYFEIFHRLGISVKSLPNITSPIMLGWSNYQGYYLSIALNKIGGFIHSINVYRTLQ